MRWFKHMSDLPRDEGIARYLDKAGSDRVAAYGFLHFLLEAIASRMDAAEGHLVSSATYSIPHWGRITYSHPNRVRKYLELCKVLGWVQVEFEGGSCKVDVPRMVEWRDETTRKSGVLPEQVAQKREEQKRTEERESRKEPALSDCLTAEGEGRSPPQGFEVSKGLQEWAVKNYPSVDIEKETAKFLLYEFSTPRSDWDHQWKIWIQRAFEYQENRNPSSGTSNRLESLRKLGKELGVEKGSDESELQYCDRIEAFNEQRIERHGL